MKILYIGHPAHNWSGSSGFFQQLLENLGSVTYLSPTMLSVENDLYLALESNFDLYVFFQFDFMAYAFVAAGKNVLTVPMVDGSGGYSLLHWQLLRNAKFVTFSKSLDKFLRMQNFETHNMKYWPEPEKYSEPASDSIYFWPRKSEFPLTVNNIHKLFQGRRSITVRISTDDSREIDSLGPLPESVILKQITSRQSHLDELEKSSIFVAPRLSEGIGHSFLESLSFGRPVVAYDFPVMSEYIYKGINGMLISKKTKSIDQSTNWHEMGVNAHAAVVTGRELYLQSVPGMEKFIISGFKKRKSKSIVKVLNLLKLSIKIYKEESHINGVMNLSHFSSFLRKIDL
jgi:Glycosyl transferases group 1